MRRLRRWLFNATAAALLAAVVVMLWAAHDDSNYRGLFFLGNWSCSTYAQGRYFRIVRHTGGVESKVPAYSHGMRILYFASFTHFGGVTTGSYRGFTTGPYEDYVFDFDLYHLIPLTAALIALMAYVRYRRNHLALKHGICHSCGYDLRASPERCPECGTIPPKGESGCAATTDDPRRFLESEARRVAER
jgi:hypothetical protein